jgi:hypothetical protein
VIGHQAKGPDIHSVLARLLGPKIAIDVLIAVFEKDRLAPIATLRILSPDAGKFSSCPANIFSYTFVCRTKKVDNEGGNATYHFPRLRKIRKLFPLSGRSFCRGAR